MFAFSVVSIKVTVLLAVVKANKNTVIENRVNDKACKSVICIHAF